MIVIVSVKVFHNLSYNINRHSLWLASPCTTIDPTSVFEHHRDYQGSSDENEGGLNLLSETVPDGFGKLLTFELGLEGDLNDVRAPGLQEIEWYYELGAKWIRYRVADRNSAAASTYKDVQPVSFHNFA